MAGMLFARLHTFSNTGLVKLKFPRYQTELNDSNKIIQSTDSTSGSIVSECRVGNGPERGSFNP